MSSPGSVAVLAREGAALVERLRLWAPARWAAGAPPYGSRGDLALHLVQSLADVAAGLEGQPPRRVPRLDSDLAFPDQLAVVTDDLLRAGPDGAGAVAAAAHLLLHRGELLGDEVPAGLARSLGFAAAADLLAAGRTACRHDQG